MIELGPILGIEKNDLYTVIIALPESEELNFENDLQLVLKIAGSERRFSVNSHEQTFRHTLLRFEFDVDVLDATYEVTYFFELEANPVANTRGELKWDFVVPGQAVVPKIGFASCNGNDKIMPHEMDPREFIMWEKMMTAHRQEELEYSFHCLILSGDQVYADPIWDRVPYFNKHGLSGRNSTKAMIRHRVDESERDKFIAELEAFYEELYFGCWNQPAIADALATIPSVMMWDDHDIFDGWGSYPFDLQNCDIFEIIYSVAKKYFELLQIRTRSNKALYASDHYSQHISFRNFEIVSLDNRSLRTQDQIMAPSQYEELERLNETDLFPDAQGALSEQRTFLFAVPVPVAHLNYKERAESWLPRIFKRDFRKSLDDDALDHWDHHKHIDEQRRLIDLLFAFGDRHDPKYIHIISGDVHSAGAGRIERTDGSARHINQLISSAIVYHPIGRFHQWVVHQLTNKITDISGYRVRVDRFGVGESAPANIYERNFGFLYKAENLGIKFYLTLEHDQDKYQWDQPRSFRS